MTYPKEVTLHNKEIKAQANSLADQIRTVQEQAKALHESINEKREELWKILDKDEAVDCSTYTYAYDSHENTILCTGTLEDAVSGDLESMLRDLPQLQ